MDRDGISFDRGRCRNGAGDDFALREQALHARVDQSGAELRQVEHAGDERDQASEIEEDDTSSETGEALRYEEMPDRAQHAPQGAALPPGLRARSFRAGWFGFGVLRNNFRGSIEHFVQSSRVDRGPFFHRMIFSEKASAFSRSCAIRARGYFTASRGAPSGRPGGARHQEYFIP